ncbi:MAG: bifunctional aspartate kinase/homoserine dehydrogenase I [Gemmatimonadales bacterium]|nr:MAG: bifunctional aspartate kinase/homoserine dehydrogenase I [Gemmatimonadales bacterium]
MEPLTILKFGGSSLADPERLRRVAALVTGRAESGPVVVVVSALGGVTNALTEAARVAAAGGPEWRERLGTLVQRHRETLDALLTDPGVGAAARLQVGATQVRERMDTLLDEELHDLLHGIFLVREASPRSMDAVLSVGERLSTELLSVALTLKGTAAAPVDARELLVSDDAFGNARVLEEASALRIRAHLGRMLGEPTPAPVPVVTGFIAATARGETATLGRGGSDYTASVLGAVLNAACVEIWTDVDGVMSADPRLVPSAFSLPEVTYAELMELTHFGAKVVYAPTVHPARAAGIPLLIRNTFRPEFPGTRVVERTLTRNGGLPVRGITSMRNTALFRLEGPGIAGVPGIARRLFGALAGEGISVILISQASSERSICFALAPDVVERARRAVHREFELERQVGIVDDLVVEDDCSILAVVGEAMRDTPNISGRLFGILGRYGINVRAIAQGSSELNISVAVDRTDEAAAVKAVHDAFFHPGTRPGHLFLAGVGGVGRALLEQLHGEWDRLRDRGGFNLAIGGMARSRRVVVDPEGIHPSAWRQRLDEATEDPAALERLVEAALASPRRPRVFVDLTASEAPTLRYEELLAAGVSVVAANKRGPAGTGDRLRTLRSAARRGAGLYLETTVGAGLPVLRTLDDLVATGDRVERIEGVLSGTLSYLVGRAMEGGAFSQWVREAHDAGFTEPDPRDDLGGMDVVRKLVILARTAGFDLEPDDVEVEPLLPDTSWFDLDEATFWDRLPELDPEMDARVDGARKADRKLAYVAEVSARGARVGLREVGPGEPVWGLAAGDNLVAFHTARYAPNPLVVQGPGAGPEVTAAGVFADILRAVAESEG